MPAQPPEYVLVEGNSDKRVIEALCEVHGLQAPLIRMPVRGGGIDQLLESVPDRIREPDLRALGIVVDADIRPASRWQSLRGRLRDRSALQDYAYRTIPTTPPVEGWISAEAGLPRVGIWLMPDNQAPGVLEDFVASLIGPDDALRPRAELVLNEIERDSLHRYPLAHRPKALIYTWLAWQETPGQPMGTAIAARALRHDASLAHEFVGWLRRLFELPAA
jgi:Protein of unknown function (DUF3226)